MSSKLLKIMVSRAELEPATTALKVRRGCLALRFRTQNAEPFQMPDRSGLHRVLALRYQTRYQTTGLERDPALCAFCPGAYNSQRRSFRHLLHLTGMPPEGPVLTSCLFTRARPDRFGYPLERYEMILRFGRD